MFERYSSASRQVILPRGRKAGNVGSGFIDTEHILLQECCEWTRRLFSSRPS